MNIKQKVKINLDQDDILNLLSGLDEIKKNSDQMTASELNSETISTFDDAFPGLREK